MDYVRIFLLIPLSLLHGLNLTFRPVYFPTVYTNSSNEVCSILEQVPTTAMEGKRKTNGVVVMYGGDREGEGGTLTNIPIQKYGLTHHSLEIPFRCFMFRTKMQVQISNGWSAGFFNAYIVIHINWYSKYPILFQKSLLRKLEAAWILSSLYPSL